MKNYAKIVKRGRPPKESNETNVVEKPVKIKPPLTDEEERQIRVKETVNSLLSEVDLTNPKEIKIIKDDVESEPITTVQRENTAWLEEQIDKLTKENQELSLELGNTKEAYDKLMINLQQYAQTGAIPQSLINDEGTIKQVLINEFRLIQGNMINMGVAQVPTNMVLQVGEPNLIIRPVQFLHRLLDIFPFLATEKRF
jgi:hypothetical protein